MKFEFEKGTGIALIAEERMRQEDVEGFDAEHDDKHTANDLAIAAAAYALNGTLPGNAIAEMGGNLWPFDLEYDKREDHDRTKQLAIAGAFCAAEIDRLNRMKARKGV